MRYINFPLNYFNIIILLINAERMHASEVLDLIPTDTCSCVCVCVSVLKKVCYAILLSGGWDEKMFSQLLIHISSDLFYWDYKKD